MRIHFLLIWLGLTFVAASLGCATMQGDAGVTGDCIVATVADGDSFRCQDGRRVRLIGVDSPEYQQRPYGERARRALLQLLPPGARVQLELDVAPHDPYGRVLAYVWSGTDLINERMVHEGWSVLYTVPPNVKYAARLGRAQKEARVHGAGLWAEHGFECLPSDFRRRLCVSRP